MYPNRGGTGTPMSSTTRALSDGRGTPQLAQHMAGSVWGVAAGATAFGGQGGVGYYQKAGQAQAGTGVASVGAGGAPAVTGQQSAQSDLHVPIKKWSVPQ